MKNATRKERQHPLIIRVTHWLNAVALAIMVTSGLRIYNASPIWDFRIPADLTLGGWLGGARQWHFFAMWILAINGVVYVVYNIATRHGRRTTLFNTGDISGVLPMIKYYLRIKKEHPPQAKYNPLQKLAYTGVIGLGALAVLTGFAVYKPTQLAWLTTLLGGFQAARYWHFWIVWLFVGFTISHVILVFAVDPASLRAMLTGWYRGRFPSHD